MLFPLLKSTHFLSLYVFLGGPAFWHVIWLPTAGQMMPVEGREVRRRVTIGIVAGAALFALTGLGDALRAAHGVIGLHDRELVMYFLTTSRIGRLTFVKIGLAAAAAVAWLAAGAAGSASGSLSSAASGSTSEAASGSASDAPGEGGERPPRDSSSGASGSPSEAGSGSPSSAAYRPSSGAASPIRPVLIAVATLLSGGLLVVMSLLSHAAGKAGLMPIVSDGMHLLASILWVGGLFYLAAAPWRGLGAAVKDRIPAAASALSALVERFSNVALAAVVLVGASGAFASYLHVYIPAALQKTSYGQALLVKIALFVVVLGIAGANLLFFGPALRRSSGERKRFASSVARLAASVRVEAVVLVGLLAAAGTLTTLPPADSFNEVGQRSWELTTDSFFAAVDMTPGDEPGEVRVDVRVTDGEGRPPSEDVRVTFEFDMLAHTMGLRPLQGQPVAPGHFQVRPLISMAGRWKGDVLIELADGGVESATFEFEAVEGARSIGQTRRFDVRAVFFEFIEARRSQPVDDVGGGFDLGAVVRDFVFSPDGRPGRPLYFVVGLLWLSGAVYAVVASRRGEMPRWSTPLGMLGIGLGTYFLFSSLLVDAYPTQFVRNPMPLTESSAAAGQQLYVAHCSRCHGPEGHGDGPMAPLLDPPPEDLRARHVDFHPDGELFWWFTHGIPGTDMPGTEELMTDEERWHVVNFVRSLHREVPDGP